MKNGVTADGWSEYDDAVPQVTGLPAVAAMTDELRSARRAHGPTVPLASVRDVIVVVSASRGGSTLFGELLRRTPGLIHLRAEVNPLYALAGLYSGASRRQVLEEELALDIGRPATRSSVVASERRRLVLDLSWRLAVQWPVVARAMSTSDVIALVDSSVPSVGAPFDEHTVAMQIAKSARAFDLPVDPWYLDVPDGQIAEEFEGLARPKGPPPRARSGNGSVRHRGTVEPCLRSRRRRRTAGDLRPALLLSAGAPRRPVSERPGARDPPHSQPGSVDQWPHRRMAPPGLRQLYDTPTPPDRWLL